MRIGLTKSASMRSTNQDYEPGQFDYRPPFRRVVRATTRPQRQSPQIYPVSMAHHNYASAPITPTDMTQSYYDQNQGFVNQMQEHANSNEYAEETNYMEHHQHQSIQMPSQRIPIYRPIVHKRAQGMAPMHQQQIRMPTDHRYIDMQGMEIQPNSSQAIFITSPSAAQPQFVPITNMNRRSVQMNHNIQQQQPQQPLMYIQPKPAGNLQQPVLFQINPMRNPPPTSFQFQPIEPPPVLQAEVCLPSDSQPTRSNQNVYSYNQQYYPQQQAPRQNTLPTLLPRRHPQNNGFVGVPASFPSSIQPTQFQFVLAPAAIPTPVLDMNSIPNITPNS
uniref:Uncharacterized protein n=1 Tax=Acrobeloides nanus TaxID=290746 RepID=A0A914D2D1_9BILA